MIKLLLPGRRPREIASEALRRAIQEANRHLADRGSWLRGTISAVALESLADAAETLLVRETTPVAIPVETRGAAAPRAIETGDVVQISPAVDRWGSRFGVVTGQVMKGGRDVFKIEIVKGPGLVHALEVDADYVRLVGRAAWLPRKIAVKAAS